PLSKPLRASLAAHRLLAGGEVDELVFGRGLERAFCPEALVRRARVAWKEAKLSPIGLHECRHTYAAFMIAAGVNAKALSTYMGHFCACSPWEKPNSRQRSRHEPSSLEPAPNSSCVERRVLAFAEVRLDPGGQHRKIRPESWLGSFGHEQRRPEPWHSRSARLLCPRGRTEPPRLDQRGSSGP